MSQSYKLGWKTTGLTPVGQTEEAYEIKHVTGLFTSGPEFTVTAKTGPNAGAVLGTIDWSMTQKVKMKFPSRKVEIAYRALNGHFDSHGGLGRVTWKATGRDGYQSSWQALDADGSILSLVELHSSGQTGTIEILRNDLSPEAFEEILVSSVAQIEDLRRLMRNAKKSAIGAVASGAGVVAVGLS